MGELVRVTEDFDGFVSMFVRSGACKKIRRAGVGFYYSSSAYIRGWTTAVGHRNSLIYLSLITVVNRKFARRRDSQDSRFDGRFVSGDLHHAVYEVYNAVKHIVAACSCAQNCSVLLPLIG